MLVSQKSTYFLIFIYIYIHTYTRLYGGKLLWIITVLFTEQFKYFFLLFPCISLAAGNQHECKCLFELACSCYCCSFIGFLFGVGPVQGSNSFFFPLCALSNLFSGPSCGHYSKPAVQSLIQPFVHIFYGARSTKDVHQNMSEERGCFFTGR